MIDQPKHGGNLPWAAHVAGCSPHELLDFSASISPLGPPPSVLAAIQLALPQLSHYPDPDYQALRWQIAQFHSIEPAWVLPGNGAAELLTWAGRDFSQLDECYCFTPSFGDYRRAVASYGKALKSLPLLAKQPDLHQPPQWHRSDELMAMVSQVTNLDSRPLPHRGLMMSRGLIINNPHNPSGQLMQPELLRLCLQRFAFVLVDEAFMDFLPNEHRYSVVSWVRDYPNLVVLRSQTKFYSIPGLRIGYAIGHPQRLQQWQRWRDPWSINTLAATAAIAALKDSEFQQRTWQWLPPIRQTLFQAIATLPHLTPMEGTANFLLVHYDGSVIALQKQLLKTHRLYIRDCLSFPELGDHFFRIAVRTEAENNRLVTGLRSILTP